MLEYLKNELNTARTENGAVTCATTGSFCLDLFSTVGGLRCASDEDIRGRFARAFAEDRSLAMKLAFYARDVRGGLGERRIFRVILRWLAENHAATLLKSLSYVAEYGRWDDLLCLMGTPCEAAVVALIQDQLNTDQRAMENKQEVSLLAKWLPSVNTSSREQVALARELAGKLGLTEAQYRKKLSALRAYIRILENYLRQKDYTFDYAKQPSKAMFKYQDAFLRNDEERYRRFLEAVNRGEQKLHADALAPYEIVRSVLRARCWGVLHLTDGEKEALNASWSALPDFCNDRNALAVVDTSGSMYCNEGLPAAVALSLGLYFGERNTGVFHNHFIEFSSRPQLIEIKGNTFIDRLEYLCTFNEVADTNIEAVFNVILDAAVRNHVPQEELPEKLYIISDMEFNCCVRNASLSNFENAKRRYAEHGYRLPQVIFWNVASRNTNLPVTMNEQGVALVSGCTPRLFSMVQEGNLSPYACMMQILGSERYQAIAA